MMQCDRLIGLVHFPIRVESKLTPEPRSLDNWDVVAPAMLFSAANCLLSIRLLAGVAAPRREQDASVLLRRLYEHVVTFAWIAIDPPIHAKKWVADDYYHRLKIDDEIRKLGEPGLRPATRAGFERYVKAHGRMPNLASRADAADKHWSKKIDGHGVFPSIPPQPGQTVHAQGGRWSLRGLYSIIYRGASANAHPTPLSIQAYVAPGGGTGNFLIGMDPTDQHDRFSYTHAPLLYAEMLLIAEHVLGVPRADDVYAAFERPAAPQRPALTAR